MSDAEAAPEVVMELARRIGRGDEVVLATTVRTFGSPPGHLGSKLLIGRHGPLAGTLGCAEIDEQATSDVAELFNTGRPSLRTYVHELGQLEAYLEVFRPKPRLVVLAATPVAAYLLRWGRDLGYETVLVESRTARIGPDHRGATERVVSSPTELVPRQPTDVVHTDHDAADLVAHLSTLLDSGARFVGVMGSRRHTGHHIEALRARGVDETKLAGIHSPVGLDIGARSAEEIALSILAGLVAARAGASGGWLDRR